jgi:ribosome production factor 1
MGKGSVHQAHEDRARHLRTKCIERLKRRKSEKKNPSNEPKPQPKTIDNQRLPDLTYVDEADPDVADDIAVDQLAPFFSLDKSAKVVLTTSPNAHTKTMKFCRQVKRCLPDAIYRTRKHFCIKGMIAAAAERGYTHLFIVQENRRAPVGLYLIALPYGPTAYFRLSSVRFMERIRHAAPISHHKPEIILNNFRTRLGLSTSRLLATLFHFDPEFRGRRVVTFHNQRDYIFFRHHRYEFKSGKKVALQEIGPRFTLRLRWLQNGLFDTKYGEYEWMLKVMYPAVSTKSHCSNLTVSFAFDSASRNGGRKSTTLLHVKSLSFIWICCYFVHFARIGRNNKCFRTVIQTRQRPLNGS